MESWRFLDLGMMKYRRACTPSQVAGRPIYGREGTEPRALVVAGWRLTVLADEFFSRTGR